MSFKNKRFLDITEILFERSKGLKQYFCNCYFKFYETIQPELLHFF